jgi:transcriptional regulator with XRE-family HTH domain
MTTGKRDRKQQTRGTGTSDRLARELTAEQRGPLGDLVYTTRIDLKLTQEGLSEAAGVSLETISLIECGHRENPRISTLKLIGSAFERLGSTVDFWKLSAALKTRSEQLATVRYFRSRHQFHNWIEEAAQSRHQIDILDSTGSFLPRFITAPVGYPGWVRLLLCRPAYAPDPESVHRTLRTIKKLAALNKQRIEQGTDTFFDIRLYRTMPSMLGTLVYGRVVGVNWHTSWDEKHELSTKAPEVWSPYWDEERKPFTKVPDYRTQSDDDSSFIGAELTDPEISYPIEAFTNVNYGAGSLTQAYSSGGFMEDVFTKMFKRLWNAPTTLDERAYLAMTDNLTKVVERDREFRTLRRATFKDGSWHPNETPMTLLNVGYIRHLIHYEHCEFMDDADLAGESGMSHSLIRVRPKIRDDEGDVFVATWEQTNFDRLDDEWQELLAGFPDFLSTLHSSD